MIHENHFYGFAIPELMAQLIQYAPKEENDVFDHEEYGYLPGFYYSVLGFDFDEGMYLPFLSADKRDAIYPEGASARIYLNTPFEFFPFGWQGGDALQYGYLILAPELAQVDYPVISYSPADEVQELWLGDDTRQGLENLMTGMLKSAREHHGEEGLRALYENEKYKDLRRRFDLNPDVNDARIGLGARSSRTVSHVVPEGWHYEACEEDVGVLAEKARFNFELEYPRNGVAIQARDYDEFLALAKAQMRAGFEATALCLFKVLKAYLTVEYPPESVFELGAFMKDAYEALGKDVLARKVDVSLECWRAM